MIAAASEGVRAAAQHNANRGNLMGHLQFWFLLVGAVLYVAWHVWEMYLRTIARTA
jgi:hypothetical protein